MPLQKSPTITRLQNIEKSDATGNVMEILLFIQNNRIPVTVRKDTVDELFADITVDNCIEIHSIPLNCLVGYKSRV